MYANPNGVTSVSELRTFTLHKPDTPSFTTNTSFAARLALMSNKPEKSTAPETPADTANHDANHPRRWLPGSEHDGTRAGSTEMEMEMEADEPVI
jgi:hypothetical protein